MIKNTPKDTVSGFVDAINKGDLEAALAFYEAEAVFVVAPGVVVTGTSAIREALAGILSLKPTIESDLHQVLETDDIALFMSQWSMRGTDPAGNTVEENNHRSADILRRQPDGNWLIAIDNPLGTDILDGKKT